MRSLAIALLLVLVLTGATCQRREQAPAASPPAMCFAPCTPTLADTGVRWDADPTQADAWDELGQADGVIPQLSGKLLTCEARRQSCAGFINDLSRRGVIRNSP